MQLSASSLGFLRAVQEPQARGHILICTKQGTGMWLEHGDFEEIEDLPDEADVYFSPNTFAENVRRKQYMFASRWLYADLDAVDPYSIDEAYEPTIAWSSSPQRYQALWLLPDALEPEAHQLMNKKLTYMLGADRSGWDCTQVLRVPGTVNYKYPTEPSVELLWSDAPPVMHWKDVRRYEIPVPSRPTTRGTLPLAVQSKLKAKTATGDRSKVLWRLEKSLLEAGYNEEQVFWVLRGTVWNKFLTDEQLINEIARAAS